jgi:uncharacterized protein YndB with AHSA1/START domain
MSYWRNSRRREEMTVASSGTAKVTLPADDQILIRGVRRPEAPGLQGVDDARAREAMVARNRGEVRRAEIDLRGGGTWRYEAVADDGTEFAFHGEYREIVPDERIVSTEVYEGMPQPDDGPEQWTLNTATFTETNGRTTLTILVQAPSKEIRDAIIASGMEAGMQDALDLLEQTAASLS